MKKLLADKVVSLTLTHPVVPRYCIVFQLRQEDMKDAIRDAIQDVLTTSGVIQTTTEKVIGSYNLFMK